MNHTITNGVVKFGRTVKTGDFENKRGDVELSFNVPDGGDADTALHEVKEKARGHLHTMLGHPEDAGAIAAAPKPKATKAKAEPMPKTETAAPKPKTDAASMVEEPEVVPNFIKGGKGKAEEIPDPAAMAEDDGLGDLLSTAPAQAKKITDKELLDATQACQQAHKNGPAIHKLLADLGVNSRAGGRVIDLPQEQRGEYLEKLKLIGPA
jgi:hypothetical protein